MESMEEESIDWSQIKVLLLDSDGVLTDGGVYLPELGGSEFRRFNIKDGFGITRLLSTGFPIAVISRSPSTPVMVRCERLGIEHVYLGIENKTSKAAEILNELDLDWSDVAFMGDDVPDLELLNKVGFPFTPSDAAEEVRRHAIWASKFPGGGGAVRECCDRIYFSRSA